MLAVGPAWHPLPFPSSPCLGRPPARPLRPRRAPSFPSPPSLLPLRSLLELAKRIRIKSDRERETCFSLASCSPAPMTSPSASLQPRDSSRPAHFFPLCSPLHLHSPLFRRRPSILFEFLHFIPTSPRLSPLKYHACFPSFCVLFFFLPPQPCALHGGLRGLQSIHKK